MIFVHVGRSMILATVPISGYGIGMGLGAHGVMQTLTAHPWIW